MIPSIYHFKQDRWIRYKKYNKNAMLINYCKYYYYHELEKKVQTEKHSDCTVYKNSTKYFSKCHKSLWGVLRQHDLS